MNKERENETKDENEKSENSCSVVAISIFNNILSQSVPQGDAGRRSQPPGASV